jgi:hypothetical protein
MAKHRSNQPPIPVVAPATWSALIAAAHDFGTLAPWTWMHDSQLLGLRDPVTGERLLCSILGRLRTVYALLVFRRNTGCRWILRTILDSEGSNEADAPDLDSGLDQDCVKVEFTAKSELSKNDLAVLAAAGIAPPAKRGPVWPAFSSLLPGTYPWSLTQAEAETLLFALPRVTAFALLGREHPDLSMDLLSEGVPFLNADFDPASRPLRLGDLDWEPPIPPPESPPPQVKLPEATLEGLLKLPQMQNFHLELDVFYAPMAVTGKERPFFPKTVLAVDRNTQLIVGMSMAEITDLEAVAKVGEVLASALQQMNSRPETIRVLRPRVAQMIAPLTARLGIPVHLERKLAVLSEARDAMMQRFQR